MSKMKKLDYSYTQNRELSWLKFNERVLEESEDLNVPLLERLKFISIFTSNLDEFYMVRCGSIYDLSIIDKNYKDNKTGLTAKEQLNEVFNRSKSLYKNRDNAFKKLKLELQKEGIYDLEFSDLNKKESKFLDKFFHNHVLPILSPQIIDVQHPFPHLSNKNLNIMLIMEYEGEEIYGSIPIPHSLERLIYPSEDEKRYILLEKIIYEYAEEIFSNYNIKFKTIVSIVRNADISLSTLQMDEDEDYRGYVKKILKKRNRLAPICLEFYKNYDTDLANFLCEKLNIEKNQVQVSNTPLEMQYAFDVIENIEKKNKLLFHKLSYNPFEGKVEKNLKEGEIIPQLNKRDILLSYPFDSIDPFLKLLKEAANDDKVISIKITIYRLSNTSSIVKYLLDAVENGKNVTVLIELRARFDENNNIEYAAVLEEAGCQVIYGFEDYKVHSKVCLITRKSLGSVQYITQLGTGNYNEKTCKLYTDLSFITMDKEIGKDAMLFFKNMAISNLNGEYKHLLVAPNDLKMQLIEKINNEIRKAENNGPANIVMKMNSLTDREMIDALEKASNAGVKIKLIIRGICCLIPGIIGHTENIEIISIVGRFLEHSRIYCFGSDEDLSIYLSSADLMTRNTEKRVEIAFPIYNSFLKENIQDMIKIMLSDNVKARKINFKGNYEKINISGELIDSQDYFSKKRSQLMKK